MIRVIKGDVAKESAHPRRWFAFGLNANKNYVVCQASDTSKDDVIKAFTAAYDELPRDVILVEYP